MVRNPITYFLCVVFSCPENMETSKLCFVLLRAWLNDWNTNKKLSNESKRNFVWLEWILVRWYDLDLDCLNERGGREADITMRGGVSHLWHTQSTNTTVSLLMRGTKLLWQSYGQFGRRGTSVA